jgi:glucan 1,3-beta-glucosidase
MVFAAAAGALRGRAAGAAQWTRIALTALVGGVLIGWTIENVPLESLTKGDWLRSLAWAAVAAIAPIVAAFAVASGLRVPPLAAVLGRGDDRPRSRRELLLGATMLLLVLLSVQAGLGLVFDPRYRDFPFAPLTGAAVPFALLATWHWRPKAPAAETALAVTLALSAVYVVLNEGLANWQAYWFCAGLLLLALTLLQARDAPG